MGAEPGRRFLTKPAAKLGHIIVCKCWSHLLIFTHSIFPLHSHCLFLFEPCVSSLHALWRCQMSQSRIDSNSTLIGDVLDSDQRCRTCRAGLLKWRTAVRIRTFAWWRPDLVSFSKVYSIPRSFYPKIFDFGRTSNLKHSLFANCVSDCRSSSCSAIFQRTPELG